MINFWKSLVVDFRIDSLYLLVPIYTALLGAVIILVGRWLIVRRVSTLQQKIPDNTTNANPEGKQLHSDSAPNLFALIIGINNYPNLSELYGASADADAMREFLSTDLGTPAEHIVDIRNEEATRKRIIEEIQNLWKNPKIKHGDPIVIYYAGHGGLAQANNAWKERYGARQIQVIFPFDYGCEIPGLAGSMKVNCIPDKTIASMMNKLAAEKGDNITLIFDSCHSASASRAGEPGQKPTGRDRRYRSADVQFDIPDDIDEDCAGLENIESSLPGKKGRDAELLLYTDQTSHVHLAACGTHEKAIEEYGRGIFTAELLKKIRAIRVDNITYDNLMKFLEIPDDQSPQCYGRHKGRILFNSRVASSNVTFVRMEPDRENEELILKAGEASGVNLGSIWELHKAPTEKSGSVGRFEVTDLYGSIAVIKPLDRNVSYKDFADYRLFARCTHLGQGGKLILKVWMSLEIQSLLFPGPNRHVGSTHEGGIGYKMVSIRDEADVALEAYPEGLANGTEVVFYWYDDISKKYGAEKLGNRKPANREQVEVVLFAAAKWRWHLQRMNSNLDQLVTMKMQKVATRKSPRVPRVFLQQPEDLLTQSDGAVEFEVDSSALYGFLLKNGLRSPLYVRMFYFDATDFSIGDMFGHNTGNGESTPDISPSGQLLIGNGADGGTPIRFSISSENQVELGYMKVFWSTEPLELDYIVQKSAFKMRPGDARGGCVDWDGSDSKWGTVRLALVLRGHL